MEYNLADFEATIRPIKNYSLQLARVYEVDTRAVVDLDCETKTSHRGA